jgi:hypothetical protein
MTRSEKPARNVLRIRELGNVAAVCSVVRDTAGKSGDGSVYNCMKTLWKGNTFFGGACFESQVAVI